MSLTPFFVYPAIRTALARDFYLAYLNTPAWRARRRRALKLAGWRCGRCGGKRDLEVHHLRYERLWREWDSDLAVVCATCHGTLHVEEGERSSLAIYLRVAREVLRADPLAPVAELSERMKRLCAARRIAYSGPQVHRALELVTRASPIRRGVAASRAPVVEGGPAPLNAQEAREMVSRLGLTVRVVPSERPDVEDEARVRAQARETPRPRVPITQRLAEIFSS